MSNKNCRSFPSRIQGSRYTVLSVILKTVNIVGGCRQLLIRFHQMCDWL